MNSAPTVILCNQLSGLSATLKQVSGPLNFINLAGTRESLRISSYLLALSGNQELPKAQLLRDRSSRFGKEYTEFMGQVNANNHSLHWWAIPMTNKNPLATELCRNTSYFLLIVDLARSSQTPLIVITDNLALAAQVKVWGEHQGIETINKVKRHWTWTTPITGFTPGLVLLAFLKTFWIWIQTRSFKLTNGCSNGRSDGYTVVISIFHPQSLDSTGTYHDVYFGALVDYLQRQSGRILVFGLLDQGWHRQLSRLKSLRSAIPTTIPTLPVETYLSLGSLLWCGLQSLRAYFSPPRINGPVSINGVDVSYLVKQSISDAKRTGNFFTILRLYYCARALAENIPVTRCFYPYENRSWEKMVLLGMRSVSPETRMVGFQHASVSWSHTNFILGHGESEILPLPDTIVTTGPVVRDWLERVGNYPNRVFKTGCALRQSNNGHRQPKSRSRSQKISKVLVVLATSLGEYVNTLVFLEKAFVNSSGYDVRIRPHPTIPLESGLSVAPLTQRDFFSPSAGSLADALEWAEVVLYASSTVGLEAISQGIPAIYLDLGDILDTDPMLGWNKFRWSVREPSELLDAIRNIDVIPQPQFQELQKEGQQYVAAYLSPVSEKGLAAFLDA